MTLVHLAEVVICQQVIEYVKLYIDTVSFVLVPEYRA